MAGAKIGGRISTSLRSDQFNLFLLYSLLLLPALLPSPKSDTVAVVSLNRFSNNTLLGVRRARGLGVN